ncbi:MAG: hypothetical protein Alis3KO_02170 [Aliiglaciecola sp.]
MKYNFILPASALFAVLLITALVDMQVIPPGMAILEDLKGVFGEYFYVLIFTIILLESIVYVGFYFPGQFFAVVLVILSNPSVSDVIYLTIAMVLAATLGSMTNFYLGRLNQKQKNTTEKLSIKSLLLAMIHINSLAFFMFSAGANNKPFKTVWLAGVLNLPYYLVLIATTAMLSEEIMQVAESTWLLASIISVWLAIAVFLDVKKYQKQGLQS